MERSAFLARIRQSLGAAEGPPLPETWPATTASSADASPERFVEALEGQGGTARLVSRYDLASEVATAAGLMKGEGTDQTAVVTADTASFRDAIDRGLARAGLRAIRPEADGWRPAAELAALGVTSARAAVAATGSILLTPGPPAPRVASLLPAAHLAIVPAEALVAGFDELVRLVPAAAPDSSAPVLVTGPSRTSDIEMTTVLGVHGPRALTVLLVD